MQLFATVVGLVRLSTTRRTLRREARKKRLPDRAHFQHATGSRLLISSIDTHGIKIREWPVPILSPRRLSLPILSPSLPSRLLRARLSPPPNGRHGRNQD